MKKKLVIPQEVHQQIYKSTRIPLTHMDSKASSMQKVLSRQQQRVYSCRDTIDNTGCACVNQCPIL